MKSFNRTELMFYFNQTIRLVADQTKCKSSPCTWWQLRKMHWDKSTKQGLFEIRGQTHLQLIQDYYKSYIKDSCSLFDVILRTDIDLCFFINCAHCKLATWRQIYFKSKSHQIRKYAIKIHETICYVISINTLLKQGWVNCDLSSN
jgi:hypothetical protein